MTDHFQFYSMNSGVMLEKMAFTYTCKRIRFFQGKPCSSCVKSKMGKRPGALKGKLLDNIIQYLEGVIATLVGFVSPRSNFV